MRRQWMSWGFAAVATGVVVGLVPPAVAGAIGNATTATGASVEGDRPKPPAQTIEQVRRQYLDHRPDAPVMVVAHRGYWRGAPENSVPAIDLAIRNGAQVAPVDVRTTTSHDAFTLQPLPETQYLTRGTHEFVISMDASAYQNFNIDYFDFRYTGKH
ncbi:hypothetical protein [Micromonospora sp. NPDC047187]|uniref:hypothetical protein n=1 Tax=Micromonospora sp. NPDC047187 TaxID=3155262 RepID=UPI0034085BE6